MNSSEFHELALRITEGTASPAERAIFDEALVNRPEWREDWMALRGELSATRDALSDADSLAEASEAIPADRLDQLMGSHPSPAKTPRPRVLWLASGLAAAACLAVAFWLQSNRPREMIETSPDAIRVGFVVPSGGRLTIEAPGRRFVTTRPVPLLGNETVTVADGGEAVVLRADGTAVRIRGTFAATALTGQEMKPAYRWFTAPLALLGSESGLLRGSGQIQINSPRGATASSEPTLAWTAEPGRTYEVELRDALHPEAPPARATAVRSPLPFKQLLCPPLLAGGIYELRVAETHRPTTVESVRFMVGSAQAGPMVGTDNASLMAGAFAALAAAPARTGDAWLLLQQLPADWRESELGRRLELAVNAP